MEAEIDSFIAKAARKCECAEVFFQQVRNTSCLAKNGVVSDVETVSESGFGVRVCRDGKLGFAFGNRLEDIGNVLERALRAAAVGDKFYGLPPAEKGRRVEGLFDGGVCELSPAEIIDRVRCMVGIAESRRVKPTYVSFSKAEYGQVIANTNGLFAKERSTETGCGVYVTAGTCMAWKSKDSRKDDLPFEKVSRSAVNLLLQSLNPKQGPSGRKLPIIFKPECLGGENHSGLLGNTLIHSLNGEMVLRGTSKLSGKIGESIFSEGLDICDWGNMPSGLNSWSTDTEGVPTRKTPLVTKGILDGFLYDFETSQKAGARDTANGFRSFASKPAISPTNFVISPGDLAESELVSVTKKGILVNWLSGTHMANAFSGDFSVEAKNAFFVKDGRIEHPIKPVMISGNIFELLKSCELGKKREQIGDVVLPSIRCRLDVVA